MSQIPYRRLCLLLSVTGALVLLIGIRLSQRGQWLPQPPSYVGSWVGADMPLSNEALNELGRPPASGIRYINPFNERVEAHIIATASYDAYHEPAICMSGYGYSLTAEKRLPLFGKNDFVRAMILKSDTDGERILMYYWLQYKDGSTSTRGNLRNYRDLAPRFNIGLNTALVGQQSCIIRAYTQIHPADQYGLQARRNLNEVAQALHDSFKQQGTGH